MTDPKRVNVDRFLRVVLAVAEARQITLAAERLGTAQPWVSLQIKEVEGEVFRAWSNAARSSSQRANEETKRRPGST
jgi:hypothetical protein